MLDEHTLSVLGLNKNMTKLYMAILRSHGLGPAQLATVTGLNRSTVYALAERLVEKKLIEIDDPEGKRRYVASDPRVLRQKAEARIKMLEQIMPELQALYRAGTEKPKVSYFEGEEGANLVFEDLLTVTSGSYCYFGSLSGQLAHEGLDKARQMVQRRISKGISSRCIRTRDADLSEPMFMSSKKYMREVRYFPQEMPRNIPDLYIYDHRLAIIASHQEQYALIIESRELASLMQTLWNMIWEISYEAEPSANGQSVGKEIEA